VLSHQTTNPSLFGRGLLHMYRLIGPLRACLCCISYWTTPLCQGLFRHVLIRDDIAKLKARRL
jgi:hypothetical protein